MGKPKQFRFGFGRKFRPKYVSVSVFWLSPFSVIRPKHFFRPKQSISAERPCFGQKFAQKYAKNIQYFGRKRHFWPKIILFGRNCLFRPKKVFRPKFRFGQYSGFLGGAYFGFGVSAKNLYCLPTSFSRQAFYINL